jgi:hypothetical protein
MRTRGLIVLALLLLHSLAMAQTAATGAYVVVWPGSKEFHTASCPLIKEAKGVSLMTRGQANGKGYTPHKACHDTAQSAGAGANGTTESAESVYVAKSDTKYHRADCKVLPKDAKRMPLNKEAVRGRWPCTVCKPPVRPAGPKAIR